MMRVIDDADYCATCVRFRAVWMMLFLFISRVTSFHRQHKYFYRQPMPQKLHAAGYILYYTAIYCRHGARRIYRT